MRKATVEGAAALRALRLEALQNNPEAFGRDYEKESREMVSDFEERLTDQTDNVIFVAIANSTPVGMSGIGKYHNTKLKHNRYIMSKIIIIFSLQPSVWPA